MAVFRKITDLRAGAAFPRFSRHTRRPFPVQGLFRTREGGFWYRISLCTPEACFEHGWLLKMRRVHQEAFLSTARIFRTGGGLLRYGMQPDMLNCSRCELLSDFLSYPFPHNLGNGRHFRQLYDKISILAIFNISSARYVDLSRYFFGSSNLHILAKVLSFFLIFADTISRKRIVKIF